MLKTGGKLPDIDRSLVRLSHVITKPTLRLGVHLEVKTALLFKEGFCCLAAISDPQAKLQIRVEMRARIT